MERGGSFERKVEQTCCYRGDESAGGGRRREKRKLRGWTEAVKIMEEKEKENKKGGAGEGKVKVVVRSSGKIKTVRENRKTTGQ